MTNPTDPVGSEEGARVRAFLGRLPAQPTSGAADPSNDGWVVANSPVRAYVMTGGRTESVSALGFEAMLSVTAAGFQQLAKLAFERARIVELCNDEPQSVAELAAKLNIPITVVRVLAADMVSVGTLDQHVGAADLADNVEMLQRLIHGIRSL